MEEQKPPKTGRLYYIVQQNDKKFGPFEEQEMIHLLKYEKISNETLVWFQGLNEWVPLATIPELRVHKVAPKRTTTGLLIRMNFGKYFILSALAIGFYFYFIFVPPPMSKKALLLPIDTSRVPVQNMGIMLKPFRLPLKNGKVNVNSIAKYSISARVLATTRYYLDWQSNLAEVDVALGWGDLGKKNSDEHITYRQSSRWYFFDYSKKSSLKRNYIITHSANLHLVPANENVRRAIHTLSRDDKIILEGFLVRIAGTYKGEKVKWESSVSRRDTGNGACEIMYVHSIGVAGKIYN